MRKTLTFVWFSGNVQRVRQLKLHRFWLIGAAGLFFAITAAGAFFGWRVVELNRQLTRMGGISSQMQGASEEIASQREQINIFNKRLVRLQAQIKRLNDFEHRLRAEANIEPSRPSDSLFGVGGSQENPLGQKTEATKPVAAPESAAHKTASPVLRSKSSVHRLPMDGRRILPAGQTVARPGRLQLAAPEGTPVVAIRSGTVIYAKMNRGQQDSTIIIDHGFGLVSCYRHAARLLKSRGDRVNRGDIISVIQKTDTSSPVVLDFEIRLLGLPVNPQRFFFS